MSSSWSNNHHPPIPHLSCFILLVEAVEVCWGRDMLLLGVPGNVLPDAEFTAFPAPSTRSSCRDIELSVDASVWQLETSNHSWRQHHFPGVRCSKSLRHLMMTLKRLRRWSRTLPCTFTAPGGELCYSTSESRLTLQGESKDKGSQSWTSSFYHGHSLKA